MSRKVPMRNYTATSRKTSILDCCQTPEYALDPLFPYLKIGMRVWEPCAGLGTIVRAFEGNGFEVIATDIKTGHNFLDWTPDPDDYDIIITNVPFGPKYAFLARAYDLGKPFAFLVPDKTIFADKAQKLYWKDRRFEWIFMSPRVNFFMPYGGYGEEKGSTAQFNAIWYTWGLNIGEPVTVAEITRRPDRFSNITVEMLHEYYREEIEEDRKRKEEENNRKLRKRSLDELVAVSQEMGMYD